ncbi:Golgi-associated plant pathogenesis-related protein 1-like [Daphnia pulicaria]|uniref:Golgi-associated plant pathogenesis-related protein 1-like n=1 Tax=Daphnia pulicaria TaxID=35523 RepID=UPI001EEB1F6E|nr:Golgi-associated plant pathogenesis-related protein 1-like [Daphnia pulicaria]
MHFQTLFFVALACALCWVNADGSASQLDESGIEIRSGDEGVTGNDLEDRAFNAFSQECLKAHNDYRSKHGVPPLALDPTVTAIAENWAKTLAARNSFFHSGTQGYGENLYASWGTQVTGKIPVDSFYAEIKDYNFNAPGFSMKTGHFTQVVWKSSKLMGVGVAKGSNGVTYVVVNYYPPGNYYGQFPANVPRPL